VKNLPLLIQILGGVRERKPEVRAVIVGDGPELDSLLHLREQEGLENQLVFASHQREVAPYLLGSKLFCLTSIHEGLPVAALEAMAFGLPVLSTSYPGVEELVTNGRNGFVCEDVSDYVERILWCLNHEVERLKMGREARRHVEAHHGPENLEEFVRLILRPL
jgi:glycosyltransferase involved in cell wall biosynthesis